MKNLPLTAEQQSDLVAWRATALDMMPYMASILLALRPVNAPGLGTFAVDKFYRLYIDMDKVTEMGIDYCAQALLHECFHIFAHDSERADEHGVAPRDRMLFNVAADCANNDDLADAGCNELAEHTMMPAKIGAEKYQTAEFYFDFLKEQQDDAQDEDNGERSGSGSDGEGSGQGDADGSGWGGCGSVSGGEKAPCELDESDDMGGHAPAASASEAKIHDIAVAAEIREAASRNPGSVPRGLREHAEQTLAPAQVNWRKQLSSMLRRTVASRLGDFDVTYSRRNRRQSSVPYGNGRIIRSGSETPIPNLAAVRDTSLSMGDSDLQIVTNEIEGIAKQLGIRDDNLIVLDVDTVVAAKRRYRRAGDLAEVAGRGGTDMANGIIEASKLKPAPTVIVCITDGYTGWPDAPLPMPVIACIIGNEATIPAEYAPPAWIRKVYIEV
jgi:predicted metal-dependent peptidase